MAKTLKLASDLSLPLTAVTETFGVLAMRGAGKSNTAAVMAEQMFDAGLPFVVIDPVGSWYGLRAGADGSKDGGIPIPIFGGRHGDVPLERGGGELLADLVVSKRLSCVLDLSGFESEAAKKAFLLAFAQRLYLKNTDPLHLFLEEADDYIPQRPMRDEAHLLRAWENIVRRGRARGLGMTLITQRSASVNKSVLTQVQTLFVLRTTGPQDRAAIEAWVKYHDTDDKLLGSLSSLQAGEGWVWSPQFLGQMSRHKFHRRRTFDSGATPKNLRGKDAKAAATLADIDLGDLQTQMAATVERAKADDPRELKKLLAAKDRELHALRESGKSGSQAPGKDVPVLTEADRELLKSISQRMREFAADHETPAMAMDRVRQEIEKAAVRAVEYLSEVAALRTKRAHALVESAGFRRILEKLDRVAQANPKSEPIRHAAPRPTPERNPAVGRSSGAPSVGGRSGDGARPAGVNNLTGPELKILTALAELEALGLHPADKQQLGLMAGYTNVRSGGFSEPLGRLVANGNASIPQAGRVAITSEGRAWVGAVQPPASPQEMQDRIMEKLTGPEQKLLREIIRHYPNAIEKAALGAACGYTNVRSGGFSEPLGRLNTLGIVRTPVRGSVVASPSLFLEGR